MRLRAMPTSRGLETEPGRPRGPGPTFSEGLSNGGAVEQKRSTKGCRDLSGRGHRQSGAGRAEFAKVEEMQLSQGNGRCFS